MRSCVEEIFEIGELIYHEHEAIHNHAASIMIFFVFVLMPLLDAE